jgi:glycosyltransferase involved in cell wall biosynthesis
MRLLYDHQVFSWQSYGGVSRYFAELLRGVQQLGHRAELPSCFFSENIYVGNGWRLPFAFKGKKWLQNEWGKPFSRHALRLKRPDVFHPTYFDPYFLPTVEQLGVPFVLTVHDMIHEVFGHGSQRFFSLDKNLATRKRLLAQKANAIVAVSENTRQDLLKFCPELNPEKIHVVHHGNALQAATGAPPPETRPYILFIGQRKGYKNFLWMLQEAAEWLRSDPERLLICVGGGDFDPIERERISQLHIAQQVQYRSVRSDTDLAAMYQHAFCFVFPSQYEGFGMPVVEAFACGCPAVLNRSSSLPEVGGNAALYFEENTQGALLTALEALSNPEFRRTIVQKGMERAQQFTWERSVARHVEVYKKTL